MNHLSALLVSTAALACFALPSLQANSDEQSCFVEAYRNEDVSGRFLSYRLTIEPPPITCDAIDKEEARLQVKAALSARGLFEAPQGIEPDLDVTLEVDMWEQVVPAKSSFLRFRPVTAAERDVWHKETTEDGRVRNVHERMVVPVERQSGLVQQKPLQRVHLFEKRLSLAARLPDRPGSGDRIVEVWRVQVETCDTSDSIQFALPIMLSAAMRRVGMQLPGREEIVLSKADKAVQFVTDGW